MRKLYLIIFSLLISWGTMAQITVQGIPRTDLTLEQLNSLKTAKELKTTADDNFTFEDIQYWIGEGSNKAALVLQWNDEKKPDALVWGYKWNGEAYGIDMIKAIAKQDPRLYILIYGGTQYGDTVGGFGFDLDGKNTTALILDGDATYPKYPENGIVNTSSYNFDDWTASDPNDHWQSGWYSKGFWSYWIKEEGENFNFSGLGASSRKLENGSWDAWNFNPEFSGGDLSSTFTAAPAYAPLTVDYTKGIFILNEDWFGWDNGTVNFLTENGDWIYRAYRKENENTTFGTTTQYGTIYGGNFYFISKQTSDRGGRLVVADAVTLKRKASFDNIGGGDGRSFVGVNENTGYIGTSTGIYLFDIENMTVGNLIPETGGGSSYSGQIGNMIRTSQYVFAVKQSTGILVIDPNTNSLIHTIKGNFNTITQSKDGNVWIGAGSKLIKVNPITFETEEITLPSTSISGSWGAWNAGSLCNSTKENVIYWTSGTKIVKYDINARHLNEDFANLSSIPDASDQVFYGAGLRVDPLTDNLILTTRKSGWGESYQYNWVHILNSNGIHLNTYKLDDYYWFPAMPVFPNYCTPEISEDLISEYRINDEMIIDLKDKISDIGYLPLSIVKKVNHINNNGVVDAFINKNDELIVKPMKQGDAIIEISFNSNGKIAKKSLTFKVNSMLGTEEVLPVDSSLKLYPNPFTDYFFINSDKNSRLDIYSVNGETVHTQIINKGKNQINIPHIKAGVYLVRVNNQTYKIIKK